MNRYDDFSLFINFFTSSKSRSKVEGSTSAKIGFAPQYSTTLADIQVKDGTMTYPQVLHLMQLNQ